MSLSFLLFQNFYAILVIENEQGVYMSYKIAFDASTKSTGYSVFDEENNIIEYDCLTASSADVIKRIQKIIVKIDALLKKYNYDIELFILEEVHPENEHTKIMHTHRALMWIQAAINFLIHERCPKAKVEYIFPNTWRTSVGINIGNKTRPMLKEEDIKKVKELFNYENINDDEADAILIGWGYLNQLMESLVQPNGIMFFGKK